MVKAEKAVVNTAATGTSWTCPAESPIMKNPLSALSSLFTGTGQPPAPPKETPPPVAETDPAIKVEVPAEVVEATAIKPKLPRESFKQHNREIEQRVKAVNLHRPMTPRSMPHARGR
jgi:hypothetical protein